MCAYSTYSFAVVVFAKDHDEYFLELQKKHKNPLVVVETFDTSLKMKNGFTKKLEESCVRKCFLHSFGIIKLI